MKMWFYSFARVVLRVYFGLLHPLRVHGKENVPTSGPVIVCGNHISMNDPLAVASCIPVPLRFMGKKELFANRFLKPIIEALGAFPVDRGASDTTALRTSIAILKEGGLLGIFPEGTRHHDNEQHALESGVALIALRANAAVVPVYIAGPYRLFRPLHLTFGKAIPFQHEGRVDRAAIDAATRQISDGLWGLMPAKQEN